MQDSLQSNRKTRDGSSHPDRDDQFLHISNQVKHFQFQNEPVISVDTNKKELIGDFKNSGTEWCEKEQPIEVKMHDFVDPKLGKQMAQQLSNLIYPCFRNSRFIFQLLDVLTLQLCNAL